jgi:LysR family hydrogen peroxide-inducible transcriptional activator
MRPTLRQLEYLVALADTLNFRQAAQKSFVTQPGLSTQIRQLETSLGVQLFERDKRRVIPTVAGTEAARRARTILEQVDQLADAARGHAAPLSGTLRLGVIPTVAPYLLPAALPAVRRRFKGLRLVLREDRTARLLAALAEGRLDLLLLALEADLGAAETRPLFKDPFVVAVPPEHPLAKKKSVREEDLEDADVLLLDDGHCLRDQALGLCKAARAREVVDFRASSLGTLVQMVQNGLGVTLLPAMAVPVETRAERRLTVRPFQKPPPARTIGLAWRHTSTRADEFELLAEEFAKHAP